MTYSDVNDELERRLEAVREEETRACIRFSRDHLAIQHEDEDLAHAQRLARQERARVREQRRQSLAAQAFHADQHASMVSASKRKPAV